MNVESFDEDYCGFLHRLIGFLVVPEVDKVNQTQTQQVLEHHVLN